MAKFRKRPVVIEARQFAGGPVDEIAVAKWCGGKLAFPDQEPGCGPRPVVEIGTLEGTMTAIYGDWIIKGVNGEFYPCKPDIFEKTYEPVEDSE